MGPVCCTVSLCTPQLQYQIKVYCLVTVNNLSKAALNSAAAGIEPAISYRKSNALTTAPPSHNWFAAI